MYLLLIFWICLGMVVEKRYVCFLCGVFFMMFFILLMKFMCNILFVLLRIRVCKFLNLIVLWLMWLIKWLGVVIMICVL